MEYIPQNRIITNLYTNGSPLQNPNTDGGLSPLYNLSTNEVYIGYYWRDYKGNYFTGKNPNDKPTNPLGFTSPPTTSKTNPTQISPLTQNNYPTFDKPPQPYNPENLQSYTSISGKDPYLQKLLPTQSYPKPTDKDYTVGNFKRYFCVKSNEQSYLEIDKKTYDKLTSKNSNWAYELYIPFPVIWQLQGTEPDVEKTNRNMVTITEQRLNRKGLKEFLRENYTKFWIPQ